MGSAVSRPEEDDSSCYLAWGEKLTRIARGHYNLERRPGESDESLQQRVEVAAHLYGAKKRC